MYFAPRYCELAAPNSEVMRIHVIGDSLIYGTGVTPLGTMPAQLETALHQDFPEELFTCLNIGHESRDMWNALILHEAMFPQGGCDLLIFSLCDNDNELLSCIGVDYSQDPIKRTYWTDPYIMGMVEKCFIKLKEYADCTNTPCLVTFYEFCIPCYTYIGETIGALCAKHGLPYFNLTKAHGEMYVLGIEDGCVSYADGHPSERLHGLAARVLSHHLRASGILASREHEGGVSERLESAVQEMLAHPYSPQDVYAWASRVADVKGITLSRKGADRQTRQQYRAQFAGFTKANNDQWLNWQRSIWEEGSRARLLTDVHANYDGFYESKYHFVYLTEVFRTLRWAIEDNQVEHFFSFIKEEAQHYGRDPSAILQDVKEPFPFTQAPQLPEMVDILRTTPALIEEFHAYFASAQAWPYQGDRAFVLDYCRDVSAMVRNLCHDMDFVFASPVFNEQADSSDKRFLYRTTRNLVLSLHYVLQLFKKNISTLKTDVPLLAVDVLVTVSIEKPSTSHGIQNGIYLYFSPKIPAGVCMHADMHHIDGKLTEGVYRFRIPFFYQADLRLFIYGADREKYGLGIAHVEVRPVRVAFENEAVRGQVFSFEDKPRKLDIKDVVLSA